MDEDPSLSHNLDPPDSLSTIDQNQETTASEESTNSSRPLPATKENESSATTDGDPSSIDIECESTGDGPTTTSYHSMHSSVDGQSEASDDKSSLNGESTSSLSTSAHSLSDPSRTDDEDGLTTDDSSRFDRYPDSDSLLDSTTSSLPVVWRLESIERSYEETYSGAIDERFVVHTFVQQTIEMKNQYVCRSGAPFMEELERSWRCWHELRRFLSSLRNVEFSLPLIFINTHGYMLGKDHLFRSSNERCMICHEDVRLNDVIYLLDSLARDVILSPLACRTQEDDQVGTLSSAYADLPELATRHVALLQPCGPGDEHRMLREYDPTRTLIYETLSGSATPRDGLNELHGQYIYDKWGEKMNDSQIAVQVHEEWMQKSDERMTPEDVLHSLYRIYKSDGSQEKRCEALNSLRHHLYVCWDAIISNGNNETLDQFCEKLLSDVQEEPNDAIRGYLIQVICEVVRNKTDPKSGDQRWTELVKFIQSSFDGADCRLKETALLMIYEIGINLGLNSQWALAVKSCLENADERVRSAAAKVQVLQLLYARDTEKLAALDRLSVVPMLIEILNGNRNQKLLSLGVDSLLPLLFSDWKNALEMFGEKTVDDWAVRLAANGDFEDKLILLLDREKNVSIAPFLVHCSRNDNLSMKRMVLHILMMAPSQFEKESASDVLIFFERFVKDDSLLPLAVVAFGRVLKKHFENKETIYILLPLFLKTCARRYLLSIDEVNPSLKWCKGESIFSKVFSGRNDFTATILDISRRFLLSNDPNTICGGMMGVCTVWNKCKKDKTDEIIAMISPFLTKIHEDPRVTHAMCLTLNRLALPYRRENYRQKTTIKKRQADWKKELAATDEVKEKLSKLLGPFFAGCSRSDSVSHRNIILQLLTEFPTLIDEKNLSDVSLFFEEIVKDGTLLPLALNTIGAVLKMFFKTREEMAVLIPPFLKSCARLDFMDLPTFAAIDDTFDWKTKGATAFSSAFNNREDAISFLLDISEQFLLSVDPITIFAGLMGVETIRRVCGEKRLDEIVGMIVPFLSNPDSRIVHYTCQILVAMAVQKKKKNLQKKHEKLIPALISILKEADVARVAAAAAAVLTSLIYPPFNPFGYICPPLSEGEILSKQVEVSGYVELLLPAIEGRFLSVYGSLLEEKKTIPLSRLLVLISSLAKTAPARMKEKYGLFIDPLMDIVRSTQDQDIRVNAFECINLMGSTVGDTKFSEVSSVLMQVVLDDFFDLLPDGHGKNDSFLEDMKRLNRLLGPKVTDFLPALISRIIFIINGDYPTCSCCKFERKQLAVDLCAHMARESAEALVSVPLLVSLLNESKKWREDDLRDGFIKKITEQLGTSIYNTSMADKSAFVPLDICDPVDLYNDETIFGKIPEIEYGDGQSPEFDGAMAEKSSSVPLDVSIPIDD